MELDTPKPGSIFLIALSVLLSVGPLKPDPVQCAELQRESGVGAAQPALEKLPLWKRVLTGQDRVNAEELEQRIAELRKQNRYAETVPVAEEVLEIRQRVQGRDHWQTLDAARLIQTLTHIASLPSEAQAELAEADRADTRLDRLYREAMYDEAREIARQQLQSRRRFLGSEHPNVAATLNDLGLFTHHTFAFAGAESLYRISLAINRKRLGSEHPAVAATFYNLAIVLQDRADYVESESCHREALAMTRALYGEVHPNVAYSLNYLAIMLQDSGRYTEAEKLHREAFQIWFALSDGGDAGRAESLTSLGALLRTRGELAKAEVLFREALAIRRALHGDNHPAVRESVHELALLFAAQGKFAQAEALLREALAIWWAVYGDESDCNTLSVLSRLLAGRGDFVGAERLLREVLVLNRQSQGREYAYLVSTMSELGTVLEKMGDYEGAEQLLREAAATAPERFGGEHPTVATVFERMGSFLGRKGEYAEAEQLLDRSFAVRLKVLGPHHPNLARPLSILASLKWHKGEYAIAESLWSEAAMMFEVGRLSASFGGLERSLFGAEYSPLSSLAACSARNRKELIAWRHLEENMARGLLDEVSNRSARPLQPEERERHESLIGRLGKLDEWISTLPAAEDSMVGVPARTRDLRRERDVLQAEFARFEADIAAKYGVAAGETYELSQIQQYIAEDVALLAWVDMEGNPHAADPNGEHWACLVRHEGEPTWVKLSGSGREDAWTETDNRLPRRVREALSMRSAVPSEVPARQELISRLYAQRIAPVAPYLSGVAHLIVLPAGWMAGIPVEALTHNYTISYAPSATMYAWLREKGRTPEPGTGDDEPILLALGDPVFVQPEEPVTMFPEPPEHGVLLAMVTPGANAERGGLREDDVLLTYGGERLAGPDDLETVIQRLSSASAAGSDTAIPVTVWRGGERLELSIAPGKLGVRENPGPVPEAIVAKRRLDGVLERSRGRTYVPLPGTLHEVEMISNLFASRAGEAAVTKLLGTEASEQRLDELATSGKLGQYRFIHLATHAEMDDQIAMRSALILSQDELGDSFERALEGREVYDGKLTAEQIVRSWRLDADLVTLSACETALGRESGGEGFLGFSQALFVAGARSLVLSLWKVEDTATMLLMRRFYENLLGRFEEPRQAAERIYSPGTPLPKAPALREAKWWIRGLTWDELQELEGRLEEAGLRAPASAERFTAVPRADHPYANPLYWAAFILMGDPN